MAQYAPKHDLSNTTEKNFRPGIYAVMAVGNGYRAVSAVAQRYGAAVFSPTKQTREFHRGKTQIHENPVLGQRYSFVEVPDYKTFLALAVSRQLYFLGTSGGVAHPINQADKARIAELIGDNTRTPVSLGWKYSVKEGEGRTVSGGPLSGIHVTVQSVNPKKGKATVSVPLFRQHVPCEVSIEALIAQEELRQARITRPSKRAGN